jgi:ribose-phosphate pyrophosphokinase
MKQPNKPYKERLKPNQIANMDLIGDVNGFDCIILDDMIDSGGTLIKASDLLMHNGANLVDVYATHGLFSGDAVNNLLNSKIGKIYYTNTLNHNIKNNKFIELDVTSLFKKALDKII